MTNLCSNIGTIAELFLWFSLGFAILETGVMLIAKSRTPQVPPPSTMANDPDAWAKVLEALTKLLLALKDLPAWIAIFLAGLALLWSLGGIPRVCPSPPPPAPQAPGK
ncbi:MAG: hypothetical protein ACREBK_07720 [Sphingomicrobium sp.]